MTYAYIAAIAIATCALFGAAVFGMRGHITGTHRFVIPFAIGIFLGVVFYELIPETIEAAGTAGSLVIVAGFLSFYVLAHFLRGYHHHCGHPSDCHSYRNVPLLLLGDAVHNLADGVVIASAFIINPTVGIATTVAIALHEIPQEIAEYGILRAQGLSARRALALNFISATSVIAGVVLTHLFIGLGDFLWVITGFAAGNLLYIAASDLIPELQHESHRPHFGSILLSVLAGLTMIVLLFNYSHGAAHHDDDGHEDEHAEEHAH